MHTPTHWAAGLGAISHPIKPNSSKSATSKGSRAPGLRHQRRLPKALQLPHDLGRKDTDVTALNLFDALGVIPALPGIVAGRVHPRPPGRPAAVRADTHEGVR